MTNESIIKKTILVIEDERPLSKVIVDKLERAGFEVLTARTVDQGLEYIEEVSSIDVVWLDHYLFGKKTGLDFVAKLKSFDSKWRQIPIFVVSNTANKDNLQSYMELGVTKYSVKTDHRIDEMTKEIKDYLDAPQE